MRILDLSAQKRDSNLLAAVQRHAVGRRVDVWRGGTNGTDTISRGQEAVVCTSLHSHSRLRES